MSLQGHSFGWKTSVATADKYKARETLWSRRNEMAATKSLSSNETVFCAKPQCPAWANRLLKPCVMAGKCASLLAYSAVFLTSKH